MHCLGHRAGRKNQICCVGYGRALMCRLGYFTKQDISCGCSCGCCETTEQREWRAQKPREHPRWSWLSTRGTCRHQSSYVSPHPIIRKRKQRLALNMSVERRPYSVHLLLRAEGRCENLPKSISLGASNIIFTASGVTGF